MARITAGVGCSHVPAIGVAMDQGITEQPYWVPVFEGFEKSREWMKAQKADVIFLVYNDHCTVFETLEDGHPMGLIGYAMIHRHANRWHMGAPNPCGDTRHQLSPSLSSHSR